MRHHIAWIEGLGPRPGLLPTFGGGVAQWSVRHGGHDEDPRHPRDRNGGPGPSHGDGRLQARFPRTPRGSLAAQVDGTWRRGADPIPTGHTHEPPIDACHRPGRPGLVELDHGETPMLRVHWRIDTGTPS